MGNPVIDLILFALLALFFVLQLWRVLGRRTGTERPPQLPPTVSRMPTGNNVLPLPARPAAAPQPAPTPARDPLQAALEDIGRADPTFRVNEFLAGARHAFEMILHAFAEGDTATLRPLVSDDVYDTFAETIRARLAAKETMDLRIERLDDPEITRARLEGRTAFIEVKFVSCQDSVTRAADGSILEGDPGHPHDRTDLWTFSRNTRSTNPNWILVATSSPE